MATLEKLLHFQERGGNDHRKTQTYSESFKAIGIELFKTALLMTLL